MSKIRLGSEDIQFLNLFEKLTGAKATDMVQTEETICFLVQKEDMGLAIGKKGSNIEKVRSKFGKNIQVIEYSEDYAQFVKNMFQSAEIREVRISEAGKGKNLVVKTSRRDKKNIIGVRGEKIKIARILLDRYLNLKDIIIETT